MFDTKNGPGGPILAARNGRSIARLNVHITVTPIAIIPPLMGCLPMMTLPVLSHLNFNSY